MSEVVGAYENPVINKKPESTGVLGRLGELANKRAGRTLRYITTAAVVGLSQPAISELRAEAITGGPSITEIYSEPILQEDREYVNKIIPKILNQIESSIEVSIIMSSSPNDEFNKFLNQYRERLANVKENAGNEQFVRGLLFLRKFASQDVDVIASEISTDCVKDPGFLQQRVENIPVELRSKFKIGPAEFTMDKSYNADFYKNPDFINAAHELSARGVMWHSGAIGELIKSGKNTQRYFEAVGYLESNGVKISPLSYLLMPESDVADEDYLKSLIKIHARGIDVGILLGKSQTENISPVKAKDIEYVNAMVRLKKAGLSESSIRDNLSLDMVHKPRFIDNYVRLLELGILKKYGLDRVNSDLVQNERVLERVEQLRNMGYETIAHDMFFLNNTMTSEKLASDKYFVALKYLHDENVKISSADIEYLTIGRASNPNYLKHVIESSRKKGTWVFENADRTYANDEVGGNLEQIIKTDLPKFVELQRSGSTSEILKDVLKRSEDIAFYMFIASMNRDDTQANRLKSLDKLDAGTKFKVLALSGGHGWTSTRNLIYDGYHIESTAPERRYTLVEDIKRNYGDAYEFLKQINPTDKELFGFLETLAEVGKLDSFFDLVGDDTNKNKVINEFLLKLEESNNMPGKAAGLVEALRTLKWGSAQSMILSGIEGEAKRLKDEITRGEVSEHRADKFSDAILWYELVAASYYKKHRDDEKSDWAREALAKHGDKLPLFDAIPEGLMFPNGTHIRYHTFFNNWDNDQNTISDKDGHRALEATLRGFGGYIKFDENGEIITAGGGRSGWNIEMKTEGDLNYIVMSKVDERTGRKMINIMNSPKMSNEQIESFFKHMYENFEDPETSAKGVQGFVMRGHNIQTISSTALEVFENIIKGGNGDVPYVNFGSCGGYRYALEILKQSKSSFFSSTQGTGTTDVNVIIQKTDMERSLAYGIYDSVETKKEADKIFADFEKSNDPYAKRLAERYNSYRWPHENGVNQVFAAFMSIKKGQN